MASNTIKSGFKRSALTVALGLCFAGAVHAQSTTGNITGTTTAGSTVTVTNDTGFTRTVTADSQGRFNIGALPVGNYSVTSGANKRAVVVTPSAAANVEFVASQAANNGNTLGTVTVTASGASAIDVTTVSTSTVVTAAELKRLPVARSAEAIALLSPGAVTGNGTYFGNQIAFGGSSVAENAYYLNGFFSGNPMTNIGGFTLPYGSIEQQETFTGGYGAKYGRSSGGVISQIGKHGTNDWHFGGQIVWQPKKLTEARPDRYNPDMSSMFPNDGNGWSYSDPSLVGAKYDSGKDRLSWSNVYSAYVGGPIIKDKLFFFVSAETEKNKTDVPGGNPDAGFSKTGSKYSSNDPKMYAKVNWNINSNNLLEATYVAERYKQTGRQYAFDWNSYAFGAYQQPATATQANTHFEILKYTGYLTDSLTLSAIYGRSSSTYNTDPYLTGLDYVDRNYSTSQNPALNGGSVINNPQSTYRATKHTRDTTDGLRVELEWLLGKHDLTLGIDNTKLKGDNEGTSQVAPAWRYGKASSGTANVSSALGIGPTGTGAGACDPATSKCGYYVYALNYFDTTSMHNSQKAYYLEDKWRITDNFMLSLGVRADKFQNFSGTGQKFVDSGIQWQPRLGFSWDVNGDSTFKVFGNAGRYFLNMPNAVAIRGVGASTFTRQYYTYTSIDANGVPHGLTPINYKGTTTPSGPVSSNGELGTPKDPLTYVPSDIKSQYQDEFVLGMEHALTSKWTVGAKVTRRELKSAIDDFCDPTTLMTAAGMTVQGFDYSKASYIGKDSGGNLYATSNCYMFNPGASNTYAFKQVVSNGAGGYNYVDGSYKKVKVSSDALGFPKLKRAYSALDLFVEHRWDGKWQARVDYTFSKSHGNSEGPANSDTGQGANAHDNGVATSQNWDAWQIMAYADGYLPNDRRHQLKAHAAYAITPEWLVSGNLAIASGAPIMCFGMYDPNGSIDHNSTAADPIGYGDSYHTCFDQPWTPGKKTAPWTHRLDVGLTWKPAALQHKLAVNLNVFNILNKRTPTSYYQYTEDDGGYVVSNAYMRPISYTTPRYVQLSASYDW